MGGPPSSSHTPGSVPLACTHLHTPLPPLSPSPPPQDRVAHLGEGLVAGGEALAKGLFRGITGIFTKPVEGAIKVLRGGEGGGGGGRDSGVSFFDDT